MTENIYQAKLIKRLRKMFPGCIILKNDPNYLQGVPDLTILHGERWAILEVKAHEGADEQPNQHWYIERLNEMSFAAFIFPEIEEEVLRAIYAALEPERQTRVSKSKSVSLDPIQ